MSQFSPNTSHPSASFHPFPAAFMSLKDAAAYLGIATITLRREQAKRSVRSFRIGKKLMFRREALDHWVQVLEAQQAA